MWVDVGKLISQHVPDKNGNVLPASISSGTYEIRDLAKKGPGTLFEGKVVFDKTYGHAAYGCGTCCGYIIGSFSFFYDPLLIPLGLDVWQGVQASDGCDDEWEDVSGYFYNNWSTGDTSIATVDDYGNHTGMGVGSTTSNTRALLEIQRRVDYCQIMAQAPNGGDNVTPTATIDSLSPNPIAVGGSASAHITVNPSTNITLTITSTGTGSATFSNGQTTTVIAGTASVSVLGVTASQSALDLSLTASLADGGSALASQLFTVSSGACTATFTGSGGEGTKVCPTQLTLYNTFNISNYCPTCTSSCVPGFYDSSFQPSLCDSVYGGGVGLLNQTLTSTLQGTFIKVDCNQHLVRIDTTVVDANGNKTLYQGGNIGLQCNCP